MFIDTNSLQVKVGNGNYISLGNYITEAKYEYNKLYASDSGRNLAGVMVSTLIGIFPKITLKFAPLTKTQLETLIPIFDSARQTLRYYDPNKKAYTTMETYTGNYSITDINIVGGNIKNKEFEVSFISTRKRA
jgi:hypothetical protein